MFFDIASKYCLFTETPKKIFSTPLAPGAIERTFAQTELFLLSENYEIVHELREKLSSLEESHISPENQGKVGSRLRKGSVFELEELATVVLMLETALEHSHFLQMLERVPPNEDELGRRKEFTRHFKRNVLKEFRTFVNADGEIDYFKHPKLKALYRQQLELEGTIRNTLAQLRNSDEFQKALQFAGHDIINDKYVLPIKSDNFSSKLGSIVARSESGRTLYVEPVKIRDFNRQRFETLLKIDHIIHEISRVFCERLAPWGSLINHICDLVYVFDEFDTRSRFAQELNLSRPVLVEEATINLEGFFHPLIPDAVKNNLRLHASSKGVLISGPNTGGKTAAIKSIALACLFARHGLFAPARQASLHLFENIFYFGNDQQSLPEGLSSFAAEVQNYSELLAQLGKSNLVIIDEIFNSTSSEEASALAIALFNEITLAGHSKVIVSTHHQTLKTLAHASDDYISCHVGFDSQKNSPTYKLVYGFPGKSMALEVFQKMTATNDTCQRIYKEAIKKLDNKMLNYEKLLSDLSHKEEKLNRLISSNQQLQKELSNQKESAKAVAKLKVEEEVEKAKTELQKIARQAREVYHQAKSGEIEGKRKLEKKISNLEASLGPFTKKTESFRQREKEIQMPRPQKLEVGKPYFCSFVNQTVVLKELKKNGEALVTKGAMTIKCPSDSLWASNVKPHQMNKVTVSAQRETNVKLEYDCRGMRLSEFQNLVENAIPELISGSVPFINFIHGHGNGTLKDWIRSYLKKNSEVEWDSNESGNDGETRVIST